MSEGTFDPWFVGISKRQALILVVIAVLAGVLSTWLGFALLAAQGDSGSLAISTILFNIGTFALLSLVIGVIAGGLGSLGARLFWRTASPRDIGSMRFWLIFTFAFAPTALLLLFWVLGSAAT